MMMTTENVYDKVYEYLASKAEPIPHLDEIISNTDKFNPEFGDFILVNLLKDLRVDMRKQAAKAEGRDSLYKAMMAVINNAKLYQSDWLHGAYIYNDFQYVCDSFRAIRTKKFLDLPKVDAGFTGIEKIFASAILESTREIKLPGVADLQVFVKTKTSELKAEYGKRYKSYDIKWDFGKDFCLVNAQYLLDIMKGMPNSVAKMGNSNTSTIYFTDESANAEAVLLPIRRCG